MASTDSLPAAVESLSLQTTSETSKFPNSYPSLNPVDVYREHISEHLSAITGIEAEKIYPRLQFTSTLDKGDLLLPVRDQMAMIP
jgi:arginyl-tRNA synthetase